MRPVLQLLLKGRKARMKYLKRRKINSCIFYVVFFVFVFFTHKAYSCSPASGVYSPARPPVVSFLSSPPPHPPLDPAKFDLDSPQ